MESSQSGGAGDGGQGVVGAVQRAIEDLRKAGDEASGEVRARIDDALRELRAASDQVRSRAGQEAGDVRDRLENIRDTIRNAGADLLEEIQAEVDRRRVQLGLGGGSAGDETGGGEAR